MRAGRQLVAAIIVAGGIGTASAATTTAAAAPPLRVGLGPATVAAGGAITVTASKGAGRCGLTVFRGPLRIYQRRFTRRAIVLISHLAPPGPRTATVRCARGSRTKAFTVTPGSGVAPAVSASYGIAGTRTVYVTPSVVGVNPQYFALLESRDAAGRTAVRGIRRLSIGGGRLRWVYPASTRQLDLRVRVVAGERTGPTLVASTWQKLDTTDLPPAVPVAPVTSAQLAAAPAPGQAGDLRLNGPATVRVGDAIVLGPSAAAPDGVLAKATSVTAVNGQTVVATVPATIPEVIPTGVLDVQIPGEPAAGTRAPTPLQRLSKALVCENGREAKADGEASVSAGLSLTTAWKAGRGFSLPKLTARFQGDVRATVNASASIAGEASCTLDREPLFANAIRLASFATAIGPVPVTGTINGQIYLSGEARVNGRIATSMRATAGATAGVEYDGQNFKPFGRLDKSFTFEPPTVTASGTLGVALAPAVEVKLYGVAGPEIDLSAGLKLAADVTPPAGEPWWKLTAPLDLGVRFRLQAWKLDLNSDRFTVWDEEPELARATTPPGGSSISEPIPSPDPLPQGIRTRLTWDSNSDVDLHTWDTSGRHAYFSDLDAIPTGFLDQDVIPGYGPETFQETTPGDTFTFGVCQYSREQANVTVDVRDPDGQTRRFTVTLRGRKAAGLLTVSPRGRPGFVPAAGWCASSGDPTALGGTSTGTFDDTASTRALTPAAKIRAERGRG